MLCFRDKHYVNMFIVKKLSKFNFTFWKTLSVNFDCCRTSVCIRSFWLCIMSCMVVLINDINSIMLFCRLYIMASIFDSLIYSEFMVFWRLIILVRARLGVRRWRCSVVCLCSLGWGRQSRTMPLYIAMYELTRILKLWWRFRFFFPWVCFWLLGSVQMRGDRSP